MNVHEFILLLDRSTVFRQEGNRAAFSGEPGQSTVSMLFPRSERRSNLGSVASCLTDDNESISLCSNINVVIVSDIGADIVLI